MDGDALKGSEKIQRQSQVSEQSDRLNRGLITLHDKLGQLIDKVSCILRPEPPKEGAEDKAKVELVVLATTIKTFGDSVKSANCKIEDILKRIEL